MPVWFREVLIGLFILGVSVVTAAAANFFLRLFRTQVFLKKGKTLLDELLFAARWPVFYLVVASGLVAVFSRLKANYPRQVAGWIFNGLDAFVFIAAVALIVYLLYRLSAAGLLWYSQLLSLRTETKLDTQFVVLFNRILKGVIFFLALLVILDHFKIDINGLLAVAGISSLAFALAAQDTLSNMISGFILMADRPFRVGDRVGLSSGEGGLVVEIGLRASRFLTDEGSILVVPNVELVRTRLTNHSFPDSRVRVSLKFLLSHDSPVERAKNIFEKALSATPGILREPEPALLLSDLTEGGLEFSLYFWVPHLDQKGKVAEGVRLRAFQLLKESKIRFAQREVWLKENGMP
ncbi:MAG: mechanosensitive ion channel family protein [candidate division Zixibacteria bacterium]|nr:mechanosensitive ion channel family protein [candidate division Zixibacteria bacterium]MCI0595716.1 mechanosensitive ion channel family protein [candidate division Zixibacteria bacterium]